MKFTMNAFIQSLGLVLQGLAFISPALTGKGKFAAAVAISAAQGVVSVASHFSNPDGTPAETPYKK